MKNPELRFNNDINDWEEKELGCLTQWDKKFNGVGNKYTNQKLNMHHVSAEKLKTLASFGNIKLLSIGLFDEFSDTQDESIINDAEVITIPSGGNANIKYYNGKFVDSGNIIGSTISNNYNLKFIYVFLIKHIEDIESSYRGVSIKHPQMQEILENLIFYPQDIAIQSQIATLLSDIDTKIETQEQKVEKLKIFKSAMLDKMFPKEGQKIPKLRFNGFSGDWEEKELGEVCNINPSSKLPNIFEYVDLESVKGTQMLNHRTEIKGLAPSRAQRLAQKNDIFYQTVRPYQKNNFLFNLEENNYVFSTGYAQLRPFYDSKFLFCIIQRDSFVNKVLDNCTGTSYPCIAPNILKSILCLIPPTLKEQEKIGKYFEELDNKIELEISKLNKLKDIKKAMLNKLLP